MQVVDGLHRGVAVVVSIGAVCVLGCCTQEGEITFQYVFNSQKNVAEAGLAHERRQRFTVSRDGGSHGLDKVVKIIQAGVDDGSTQRLKAADIQGDIVVH